MWWLRLSFGRRDSRESDEEVAERRLAEQEARVDALTKAVEVIRRRLEEDAPSA